MKRMRLAMAALVTGVALGGVGCDERQTAPQVVQKLKFSNLMRTELKVSEGIEVIVSTVEVPPHTTLPKHYHPGEEFVYVLDGSFTLWQEGKPDQNFKAGDVLKVPFKQIHTAKTTEGSAKTLVFRVHQKGQPERVPVD